MSKYGSIKTIVDGITFDSKLEAKRYGELKLLQRAKQIKDLKWQVPYQLYALGFSDGFPYGAGIAEYVADFVYDEVRGKEWVKVVEDVKSKATKTPLYRLKKKMMLANYGIEIRETS